jgi:hypothetical protein
MARKRSPARFFAFKSVPVISICSRCSCTSATSSDQKSEVRPFCSILHSSLFSFLSSLAFLPRLRTYADVQNHLRAALRLKSDAEEASPPLKTS